MMRGKDYVIMELFADDPDRQSRIFEVFSHLYIPQRLENSQKTKLRPLCDAFDLIVIDNFFSIETVRASLTSEDQIDKLLSAMTMIAYQRITFDIHLLFYVIDSFCQDC